MSSLFRWDKGTAMWAWGPREEAAFWAQREEKRQAGTKGRPQV